MRDWLARPPAEAAALAWPGGRMSRGELAAAVDALAGIAASLGAPGAPLAVVSASRVKLILGLLAGLRAGRPVLPIEPDRPGLEGCLAACGANAALADDGAPLPDGMARADFDATPATSLVPPWPEALPPVLAATSGSAAAPRVAIVPARALSAQATASARVLPQLGPADAWLSCVPASSIGGIAALWRCLAAGACLVVLERFEARPAWEALGQSVTHVSIVPAMLGPLREAGAPPPALRCLLAGGGPLSAAEAQPARAAGWPLWIGWGMTETASHVAAGMIDEDWSEGFVGRPLPGVEISVAGDRLRVAGATLMAGYARPGLAPGEGLAPDGRFVTGDAGCLEPDGRLRVFGRADCVIVTGGVNVHPEAVEAALSACAGIGEVAVYGEPDARWGARIVALYTGAIEPEALRAWARERLPSAWRPRRMLRVAGLPRNAMGKLRRDALANLELT